MFGQIFDPTFESTFITNDKCYLGSIIPGKTIAKSLGLMSMVTKGINGNINKELEILTQKFVNSVEKAGGNAIINFRFETGSYQQIGSAWITSYLLIYGEGVLAT